MKYDLIDIGKRLRELRVEHGYQQKYVAKKDRSFPEQYMQLGAGKIWSHPRTPYYDC